MRPLHAVEVPSYQPSKPNSTSSSINHTTEPRDRPRGGLSRAEAAIQQLQNFGSDLGGLERRTQGLFMDQASLNFNLSNRLRKLHDSPLISLKTPTHKHPSVPGPLQHPFAHFGQRLSSMSQYDGDEDVEMGDAPDVNNEGSTIVPGRAEHWDEDEGEGSVFPTLPIIANGQTPALPLPAVSHSPTPGQTIESPLRHPLLQTTTTSTADQIELELSFLIVQKHSELRLIQTELAKAQIMLEQLRRVHLRNWFPATNEKGEVYATRLVLRKFSSKEKRVNKESKVVVELIKEEQEEGGSGMKLRSKRVKR